MHSLSVIAKICLNHCGLLHSFTYRKSFFFCPAKQLYAHLQFQLDENIKLPPTNQKNIKTKQIELNESN